MRGAPSKHLCDYNTRSALSLLHASLNLFSVFTLQSSPSRTTNHLHLILDLFNQPAMKTMLESLFLSKPSPRLQHTAQQRRAALWRCHHSQRSPWIYTCPFLSPIAQNEKDNSDLVVSSSCWHHKSQGLLSLQLLMVSINVGTRRQ